MHRKDVNYDYFNSTRAPLNASRNCRNTSPPKVKVKTMNESIVLNFDSGTTAKAVMMALARHGLLVIRSFDLRSALNAQGGCECPHHGAAQCNCQFVVLLAYGEPAEPVAVTLHSRDNWTEIWIVHDAMTIPDPNLAEEVMVALVEAAFALQAATVPTQEVTAHAG
jgi:hypothetical protein